MPGRQGARTRAQVKLLERTDGDDQMPAEEPCTPGAPGAQRSERAPGREPRVPSQLLPELYTFVARVLFYLAPVYLAGYLGLSITWLLLGALLWMWWRRNRRGKLGRLAAAFEFLENERQFISRELRGQHLPAWVIRAEWSGGRNLFLEVRKEPAAGRGAGARRSKGGREPGYQHIWSPEGLDAQTVGAVAPLMLIPISGPPVLGAGT